MIPTPNSELYLLSNVELDPDYNYTIDFDNKQAQQAYFQSKISNTLAINEEYSFVRADESVKVQASIEDLDGVNYIMYKNDTRWNYAFITKKEYVSTSVTRLILKYDVYQTFMFDFSIEESFIDREHQDRVNRLGRPIFNIEPENLEIGDEYVVKNTTYVDRTSEISSDCQLFYLIRAKEKLGNDLIPTSSKAGEVPNSEYGDFANTECKIGETRTGIYMYIVPVQHGSYVKLRREGTGEYNRSVWARNFASIDALFEDPRVMSITLTRYLPKFYEGQVANDEETGGNTYVFHNTDATMGFCAYDKNDAYHFILLVSLNENEEIDNQFAMCKWRNILESEIAPISQPTPNPNEQASINFESKLKTSPFSFIRLNCYGETRDFKNEDFYGNPRFSMYYSLGAGGSTMFVPDNYNGIKSFLNAFKLTSKLEITLRTDKWQEYILNNKASINGGLAVSAIQTIGSVGIGLATGGMGLAMAGTQALNFGGQIANEMMKRQDIKNQPDDIKANIGDTEIINATTGLYIKFEDVEIKESFKQKCYKYFQHYGYKANEFKKPDTRSRFYFNYIKTIGANIKTNIDAEYKSQLANIFDTGVTIWHYRGSDSFKGVNNYEYENAEMALIGG